MKVFRGDQDEKFEVKSWVRSRYGIHALFFTPDVQLARLYYQWHSRNKAILDKEYIYTCQLPDSCLFEYDYGGKPSNSSEFRSLIYTLNDFRIPAALIKNVVDYPDASMPYYKSSDIVVVFDFSVIKALSLIK